MPMPTPLENESKQEFIDRFLSDSLMIEEYSDTNQRLAVANSEWDKTLTKEVSRFALPLIKEFEEVDGEFYSQGYVATTHPDRTSSDDFDGDILSKEALQTIVDLINSEVATADCSGATRLVSYRHDWVKQQDPSIEPAGIVLPPAELRPLDNGHWGVWVKVHHNKNHPLYERIIYEVKNGYLPGYSIEYVPGESTKISVGNKVYRFLKTISNYVGHAFANARMIANPKALIESMGYKELESKVKDKPLNKPFRLPEGSSKKFGVYVRDGDSVKKVIFGDPNMEIRRDDDEARTSFRARHKCDEQTDKTSPAYWSCRMWSEDFTVGDVLNKEMESKKMDYEKLKKKMEDGEELTQEEKEFMKAEDKKLKAKMSEDKKTPSPASEKKPESKELPFDLKEVVAELKESPEFKEAISSLEVKQKVLKTQGEQHMGITIKEMNQALKSGLPELKEVMFNAVEQKQGFDVLFKEAIRNPENYTVGFNSKLNIKTSGKGLKIVEIKDTLVPGDNTSAYNQEDVEFADVFATGIIDTFNNQANLFGYLKKENHPEGAGMYYQWKMVTNRNPDGNDTFVSRDSIAVSKNFSSKENYQTPLIIARRGISVSDFTNRYSARSLGDLFKMEVDLQMLEMMKDVNIALFSENEDGNGNAPLGLEAVADSAGNTTLYGKTRTVANRLAPTTASDTYVAVGGSLTEGALRTKISYLQTEGTALADIAIVCSPAVRDYMFNLFDGNRRFGTAEATFGFTRQTVPTYDGVPIIVDSDCNSDALYVVDSSAQGAVIVIGLNPQIVNLAKIGMSTEAVIEMHFAFVYKQPRRVGMLDTLSGPSA